jgi:hypothetical protein
MPQIKSDSYSGLTVVKSPDLVGDIGFRIAFEFPVHIMLSHPICKFRSRKNYPVREGTFIANMGIVPVFFQSMNMMTVLLLYNERTEDFFSPMSSPLSDTETVCWELPAASRQAEFSSMNFILQNGSDAEVAAKEIAEVCKMYFDYGYWPAPLPGFVPSTHFLHSRQRITSIVKVTKSLYVVEEIGNVRHLVIEGHSIECREVMLKGLAEENGQYFFKHIYALMDKEEAEQIEAQGRLGNGFINAMVAELRRTAGARDLILTLIADYGNSYFELLQSLIGIVASKQYYNSDSVAKIGDVGALREGVYEAFIDIKRHIKIPRTVSDQVENSFEIAVKSLFPILVIDGNKVYYTHPMLIGFFKKWKLYGPDQDKNKEALIHLLRLIDKIPGGRYSEIYLGEDAEYFQRKGFSKAEFIRNLTKITRLVTSAKNIDKLLRSSDGLQDQHI